jgi:hypothetical protein
MIFEVMQIADLWLTAIALKQGHSELNPLYAYGMGFIALKLIMPMIITTGLYVYNKQDGIVKVGMGAILGMYVGIIINNLYWVLN